MEAEHSFTRASLCVALLMAAACSSSPDDSRARSGPTAVGPAAPPGAAPTPAPPGAPPSAGNRPPPNTAAGAPGAAVGGRGVPGAAGAGITSGAGMSGSATGAAGSGTPATGSGAAGMQTAAASGSGGRSPMTGAAGMGAAGSTAAGGTCCPDTNCVCRDDVPSELTADDGPYRTATTLGRRGTVHYPTGAEPPFAAIAITPGFLNTGPEMRPWGAFYASWGIVTHVTSAGAGDIPEIRAALLLEGVEELKAMNMDGSSPISGKLSGRYGISGYSYGGGGATIGASRAPELATSIGLAPFGGSGRNSQVATLVLCGESDVVAACFMADSVYAGMPEQTPKMYISVPGAAHLDWFSPTAAGRGTPGKYALAFQKVFLEGDQRWKPLLMQKPASGDYKTNIQ